MVQRGVHPIGSDVWRGEVRARGYPAGPGASLLAVRPPDVAHLGSSAPTGDIPGAVCAVVVDFRHARSRRGFGCSSPAEPVPAIRMSAVALKLMVRLPARLL